jgi:hypothetical protein
MFWNHVCYDTNFVDIYKYLVVQWKSLWLGSKSPINVRIINYIIFYLNCKCHILHNCIINLYARNLNIFTTLEIAFVHYNMQVRTTSCLLPIQTLCQIFTSVVGFRHMHYTVFLGQVRHMGNTSHRCPCHWCYKLKKYEKKPCFHPQNMGFHISLTLTIQREILTNINPTSANIMLTNWTPIMVH